MESENGESSKKHGEDAQRSETDKQYSESAGGKRFRTEDEESEIEYVDENGKKRRAKRRSK